MSFRLHPWILAATALLTLASGAGAQLVDPIYSLTHIDIGIGRGPVAGYPDRSLDFNERVNPDFVRGYSIHVSAFAATRWEWYVGGEVGIWASAEPYSHPFDPSVISGSGSRGFSAYVGPTVALDSQRHHLGVAFGMGLLVAGTAENLSNSLYSPGVSFSAHKYWMLNDRVGFGPGAHILLPVFGQISYEGPELLELSFGLTVLGKE